MRPSAVADRPHSPAVPRHCLLDLPRQPRPVSSGHNLKGRTGDAPNFPECRYQSTALAEEPCMAALAEPQSAGAGAPAAIPACPWPAHCIWLIIQLRQCAAGRCSGQVEPVSDHTHGKAAPTEQQTYGSRGTWMEHRSYWDRGTLLFTDVQRTCLKETSQVQQTASNFTEKLKLQ
jgi:hypothetical protein